ncbi:hypothetical protein WA538_000048 [Blastocystis sp. DL]
MMPNANELTIIILYSNQKYGLLIPDSYTIRQIKKEIQTYLGIKLENQVLSYDQLILENDKTVSFYNIQDSSEILLIENAFQDHLVNKDVDLIELDSWLDYLNTDYENASRFMQDADYILNKLHENEHKPYALEAIDNAIAFVRRCNEKAGKLQLLCEQLARKYAYMCSEYDRFLKEISESKVKQMELAKELDMLNLRTIREGEIEKLRSSNSPPSLPKPPSTPVPQERNPIKSYLWSLNSLPVAKKETMEAISDGEEDTASRLTLRLPSYQQAPKLRIVRINADGRVVKGGQGTEEDEDEEIRQQRVALVKEVTEHIDLPRRYPIHVYTGNSCGLLQEHTRDAAMRLIDDIENHPDHYSSMTTLDLSYCGIGNEGFIRLISAFMNNSTIPLQALHLAGNGLGANQIFYLLNQLHMNSLRNSQGSEAEPDFIFPKLQILNLNGNPIGNSGVMQLFRLFEKRALPSLHQICLINTCLTTEVTSMLINVNLHENNLIDIVIPETQMAQMTESERDIMLRLYDRIEKRCVSSLDIDQRISDTCMQLYFYTVIESIDDGLQRLSIRDVDFSGNCGTVFMSLFAQYVRYGRCRKLSSLTLSHCSIGDRQVLSLCDLVSLFASQGLKEFHYLGLDNNMVTSVGLMSFLKTILACREKKVVIDFSIIGNPIGDAGLAAYLNQYYSPFHASIDTLNLNGCAITDIGLSLLSDALGKLTGGNSIRAINLSDNPLTDSCVVSMTQILQRLPLLRNLYLEKTEMTEKGLQSIVSYYVQNRPSQLLYLSMRSRSATGLLRRQSC